MSRSYRNSYEAFRQKAITISKPIQQSTPNTSSQMFLLTKQLQEVDSISKQLSKISRRASLSSSFCLSMGGLSTNDNNQEHLMASTGHIQHECSSNIIEIEHRQELDNQQKDKKWDLYENFDAVDEIQSIHEQQLNEDIEQNKAHAPRVQHISMRASYQQKRNERCTNVRDYAKKNETTTQSTKQKTSQYDLGQLDSMKQQLDKNHNKKVSPIVRQPMRTTHSKKQQIEPNKISQNKVVQINNKNIEKPKLLKYDNPTIRKPQNSQVHENRTTNEKIKHMNIRSQGIEAQNMLQSKEKQSLKERLLYLCAQIEKNEVYRDTLPDLNEHISSLQKLLGL